MSTGSVMPSQESSDPVTDVLAQLLASLTDAIAAHPWLAVLVGVAVVGRLVRAIRVLVHGGHPKDPQRLFLGSERHAVLARAGHRCEHHSWLSGRCSVTDRLQVDHVHPHSHGGATTVANGQALCGRHNARKGNRIPWRWELDLLARRRSSYVPEGMPTAVVRRG